MGAGEDGEADHVDILFANETEILSLYQVDSFDQALQKVRGHAEIAALTRSEKGSVVLRGDEVHVIDAVKGVKVVDTTGAGDCLCGTLAARLAAGDPLGRALEAAVCADGAGLGGGGGGRGHGKLYGA